MFYNVDILTRRKSGLGIVWLAATLGNRSVFRKLNKKEVANVDIERACQTVISPAEPMALRLSSQLMHGIVRVYVQQNELWMADVTNAHAAVRKVLVTGHSDGTAGSTAAIDLPAGQRRARKDQITLPEDHSRLQPQYYGRFDFDMMAWEFATAEEESIYGDFEPDRASRATSVVSHRHTVDLSKITLPSAELLLEDATDRELDYHGPAGVGLGIDFGGNDGEQHLDLGLHDQHDDRDRSMNDGLPPLDDYVPPLVETRPPSYRDRLSDLGGSFRGAGLMINEGLGISSSDVGLGWNVPRQSSLPPFGDDMPHDVSLPDAHVATFSQAQEMEDRAAIEASMNSLEREVLMDAKAQVEQGKNKDRSGAGQKKKRVSFVNEDPRIELTDAEMRNAREHYKRRMIQEQAALDIKKIEKAAQKEANALLNFLPPTFMPNSAVADLWESTVGTAATKIDEENKEWRLTLATLPEEDRVRERQKGEAHGMPGTYGEGQTSFYNDNDELPPLEDMPDFLPNDGPGPYLGPSDSFSGSGEIGRGITSGSDRVQMPWNIQDDELPFNGTQEDPTATFQSFSMAGTPTGMPNRAFPRESSLSQLSAGPDSTLLRTGRGSILGTRPGQQEGLVIDEEEAALLGGTPGVGAGQTSQLPLVELRRETENFFTYTKRIAASLPHNQALFFSDVVPVADNMPTVAAQAFYQMLTLVTNRRLLVKQEEAYGEIAIDFVQTPFIMQEPGASLTA
ncbi:hypothetical protein K437DRAFT_253663 [Tilletiaria anomala UBC 951]|uniref:Rad21/Rec8-like protein N-terminal domain-containing protein n=1 Tax=Tilletiaria anomala (strain ATCC 24038 / CBS 436.72 / UBC 951) TaxID=1037660 RepID=A0A066WKB7_TILAU|nr:uncharacterized protein K437DRAFT_253663 [Tilletiaria anomala UBC 951]KDN53013.1 hypothetical protein K437DRAFT_253663 [Tilletiaria anomala UBC 951]